MTEHLTKVTVNLIPAAWRAVEDAADREGLTHTEVINRAVQMYALITAPLPPNGRFITDLEDPALRISVTRRAGIPESGPR